MSETESELEKQKKNNEINNGYDDLDLVAMNNLFDEGVTVTAEESDGEKDQNKNDQANAPASDIQNEDDKKAALGDYDPVAKMVLENWAAGEQWGKKHGDDFKKELNEKYPKIGELMDKISEAKIAGLLGKVNSNSAPTPTDDNSKNVENSDDVEDKKQGDLSTTDDDVMKVGRP